MKTVEGNLIELAKNGTFDVIVHGCNCWHVMGGGIALQIKEYFPAAYHADLATKKGDILKLGDYSRAVIPIEGRLLVVVNAYTQLGYGTVKRQVNYEAVADVFNLIKKETFFVIKKLIFFGNVKIR